MQANEIMATGIDWLLQIQATVLMALIDYVYLSNMKHVYAPIATLHKEIRVEAAIATWFVLVLAIQLLVLGSPHTSLEHVFRHGAILGGVIYAVYNLTNLATIEVWTVRMGLSDTLWGMLLVGAMSVVMHVLRPQA